MINQVVASNYIQDMTMEEGIEELEMLQWEYGISDFEITENSKKRGRFTYNVQCPTVDIEDDIVFCDDSEHAIQDAYSVLIMFSMKDVLYIHKVISRNSVYGEIRFKDGVVTIRPL